MEIFEMYSYRVKSKFEIFARQARRSPEPGNRDEVVREECDPLLNTYLIKAKRPHAMFGRNRKNCDFDPRARGVENPIKLA